MKKNSIIITLLLVWLVASNLVWLYLWIDAMETIKYNTLTIDQDGRKLAQALAILPIVAKPDAKPSEVIEKARKATNSDFEPFEKEGFTVVGFLSLKFNKSGRLVEVE